MISIDTLPAPGDLFILKEKHPFRNTGEDDLEFICVVPLDRLREGE